MVIELSPETRTELRRYIDGDLSNAELADWLVGAEYDPKLGQEERDALARIRLVVMEAEEGQREPSAILEAVLEVLGASLTGATILAFRTGSATSWQQESELDATPARFQRVGI